MINGKRYIGQKKFDNASRWKSYLGSGYHLMNAISKYRKENFIRNIVDIAYSENELNDKENEWIRIYKAVDDDNYYNMIDGGNVQESLKRKNSIPCICIDNNFVFKSIKDASLWSGYTEPTIRRTFKRKHKFNNKNERLIFRPLSVVKKNKNICCVCGGNFSKKSNSHKMCEKCSSEKGKSKLIINHNFNKNEHGSVVVYKLSDKWVRQEIELNTKNKIKYDNYIEKPENKKTVKKSTVKRKKTSKINKKEIINLNINVFKEDIVNLYLYKEISINEIIKKLHIKGLTSNIIKNALSEWEIELRPQKPFLNEKFIYYNGIYNSQNNLIKVFKYKHETRRWVEAHGISEIKRFSPTQLNYLMDREREYNGYFFRSINQETYENFKNKTQRSLLLSETL